MKKLISIIIITAFSFTAFAQQKNVDFSKENFPEKKKELKLIVKKIDQAKELLDQIPSRYDIALPLFADAQKFNPNNSENNYYLGKCHLLMRDYKTAIPLLEKSIALSNNNPKHGHFCLAFCLHQTYEFDNAVVQLNLYESKLTPIELKEEGTKIDKLKKECGIAKIMFNNPKRVFIDNLGDKINTNYQEYNPVINTDESTMMFVSRRPDGLSGDNKDPLLNVYFEDIYYTKKVNEEWGEVKNIGKPVNSTSHDAIVGISPDGQILFIYKSGNGGDLYECKLNGTTWGKPRKLPKTINTEFHEQCASFSYDLNTIYFISDREGGFGKHDIWMSKKDEKGKWQKAEVLPGNINTSYEERSVFMHPDGKTMYFSSDGHDGMGELDLYKTTLKNGHWSTPENLGYPINTPSDDIFFYLNSSGKHGYYTSIKEGGQGLRDLYMITFLGPEKPIVNNTEEQLLAIKNAPVSETVIEGQVDIIAPKLTLLKGVITDGFTNKPIHAKIILTDNSKNIILATFESNSETGRYLVSLPSGKNYGISVEKEEYMFHSVNIDTESESDYQEIEQNIALFKIAVGSKVVLKNIFFDTGKSIIKKESYPELDRLYNLLSSYPNIQIEISGHTDDVGSDASNLRLSDSRAKAVVKYLLDKGIPEVQMIAKGYGEVQPIADNKTKEGRQQNRRTEFKILKN